MPLPVAENWFEISSYSDDITLIFEPHVIPDIRCNMWHVRGRERDLLFDSGMGVVSLKRHVPLVTEKPLLCVASHSHFDHVGGHHEFDTRLIHATEAEILTTPNRRNTVIADYVTAEIFTAAPFSGFDVDDYAIRAAPPTRLVGDGDILDLGDRQFDVLHLLAIRRAVSPCGKRRPQRCCLGTWSMTGHSSTRFTIRCPRTTPSAWNAYALSKWRPCTAVIGQVSGTRGLLN